MCLYITFENSEMLYPSTVTKYDPLKIVLITLTCKKKKKKKKEGGIKKTISISHYTQVAGYAHSSFKRALTTT